MHRGREGRGKDRQRSVMIAWSKAVLLGHVSHRNGTSLDTKLMTDIIICDVRVNLRRVVALLTERICRNVENVGREATITQSYNLQILHVILRLQI